MEANALSLNNNASLHFDAYVFKLTSETMLHITNKQSGTSICLAEDYWAAITSRTDEYLQTVKTARSLLLRFSHHIQIQSHPPHRFITVSATGGSLVFTPQTFKTLLNILSWLSTLAPSERLIEFTLPNYSHFLRSQR